MKQTKHTEILKENVELRLKELGMTKAALAQALGVPPQSITQTLTGNPGLNKIEEVARELDISPGELLLTDVEREQVVQDSITLDHAIAKIVETVKGVLVTMDVAPDDERALSIIQAMFASIVNGIRGRS